MDAVYFSFISLSTIGFGDFVTSTYPPDKFATLLYNGTECFRALIDPVGKHALNKETGLPSVCNPVINRCEKRTLNKFINLVGMAASNHLGLPLLPYVGFLVDHLRPRLALWSYINYNRRSVSQKGGLHTSQVQTVSFPHTIHVSDMRSKLNLQLLLLLLLL